MLGQQTNACSEPRCVASLLDRLDGAAAGLRAGRALGPYMLEALLDDVALCPAMAHREGLAEDRHDALASAISEARRAVAVVLACPVTDRDWAIDRLAKAITESHRQLAVRVADAVARGDTGALFSGRCANCAFA